MRQNPELTEPLASHVLEGLSWFYEVPGASEEPVTPEDATIATAQYARAYNHAVPFRRDALADLWERCDDEPSRPGRCQQTLARIERVLGALVQ